MQNQRGFIGVGVFIAILVGLALLGGGAYYVTHQQTALQIASENQQNNVLPDNTLPTKNNTASNQPSNIQPVPSATTPTSNNTVSWKTYTNEKLGLEFKYPPTFTVETVDGYGPGNEDVALYNYKTSFQADYPRNWSNFGLLFRVYPTVPDIETSVRAPLVEKVAIGGITYDRVRASNGGHGADYYLKSPSGTGDVAIKYSPIIDISDIGALGDQSDYVAGVNLIMKDSRFLDSTAQQKILNAVLATVRLTYVAPPVAAKDTVNNLTAQMFWGGVAPGQVPTTVDVTWSFDTAKGIKGMVLERKVASGS